MNMCNCEFFQALREDTMFNGVIEIKDIHKDITQLIFSLRSLWRLSGTLSLPGSFSDILNINYLTSSGKKEDKKMTELRSTMINHSAKQ